MNGSVRHYSLSADILWLDSGIGNIFDNVPTRGPGHFILIEKLPSDDDLL